MKTNEINTCFMIRIRSVIRAWISVAYVMFYLIDSFLDRFGRLSRFDRFFGVFKPIHVGLVLFNVNRLQKI